MSSSIKVAFLLPVTSKGREEQWKTVEKSYLFNRTVPSVLNTNKGSLAEGKFKIEWYICVDEEDKIYSFDSIRAAWKGSQENLHLFKHSVSLRSNIAAMWNRLFSVAYDDGCTYFYQCGDDIVFFETSCKNWIWKTIKELKKHFNVGIAGPISHRTILELTQCMVSSIHYQIFGYFFPHSYRNFGVDEWSNQVYQPDHYYANKKMLFMNVSGEPRYLSVSYESGYPVWYLRVMMGREIFSAFLQKNPVIVLVGFTAAKVTDGMKTGMELVSSFVQSQTYLSTRMFSKIVDLTSFQDVKKCRKEILTEYANSNAIVVFVDPFSKYQPDRVRHAVDVLSQSKLEVCGCHQIFVKCSNGIAVDSKKRKRHTWELKSCSRFRFNDIFWQTIAFKINFWKNHIPLSDKNSNTLDISSLIGYSDYPLLLLDRKKTIKYVKQTPENSFNFFDELLSKFSFARFEKC